MGQRATRFARRRGSTAQGLPTALGTSQPQGKPDGKRSPPLSPRCPPSGLARRAATTGDLPPGVRDDHALRRPRTAARPPRGGKHRAGTDEFPGSSIRLNECAWLMRRCSAKWTIRFRRAPPEQGRQTEQRTFIHYEPAKENHLKSRKIRPDFGHYSWGRTRRIRPTHVVRHRKRTGRHPDPRPADGYYFECSVFSCGQLSALSHQLSAGRGKLTADSRGLTAFDRLSAPSAHSCSNSGFPDIPDSQCGGRKEHRATRDIDWQK